MVKSIRARNENLAFVYCRLKSLNEKEKNQKPFK